MCGGICHIACERVIMGGGPIRSTIQANLRAPTWQIGKTGRSGGVGAVTIQLGRPNHLARRLKIMSQSLACETVKHFSHGPKNTIHGPITGTHIESMPCHARGESEQTMPPRRRAVEVQKDRPEAKHERNGIKRNRIANVGGYWRRWATVVARSLQLAFDQKAFAIDAKFDLDGFRNV